MRKQIKQKEIDFPKEKFFQDDSAEKVKPTMANLFLIRTYKNQTK